MKRLGLLVGLFMLAATVNTVNAACIRPQPLNTSLCPTTNAVSCSIPNYTAGVTEITCCETQNECDTVQNGTVSSSSFSPFTGCTDNEINTALGCISVDGTGFVTTLLNFGIGIAGGIAMLLIIFGGFQILTSAGNPERLNEGKELISSAMTGLLMIIFSVFLLRIIGVDVLGIPSFS